MCDEIKKLCKNIKIILLFRPLKFKEKKSYWSQKETDRSGGSGYRASPGDTDGLESAVITCHPDADSYFYTQQDWDVFSGGQTTAEQSQAEAVMICSIRRQETEVFPDTLGNFRARDVFRFTFLQWAGVWLSWRGLSVAPLIPPDRRVRRYLNKLESCSSSRSCCPSLLPGDKRCLHSWRHEVWH